MTSPDLPPGPWQPPAPGTPTLEPPRPPEPVALPFAPVRGWQQADTARRVFILAFPLLVVSWVLPNYVQATVEIVPFLWLFAPGIHFSVARLLRPYPSTGVGGGRKVRHALAAFGSAVALGITLLAVFDGPIDNNAGLGVVFFLGLPALFTGLISAVWGIVDAGVRTGRRSRPSW